MGVSKAMTAYLTLDELLARTALTAEASTIHKPFGSPSGPGLFHKKGLQLPAYIQHVAHHLVGEHGESKAIEMAVGLPPAS
jgi:hypothetical protein